MRCPKCGYISFDKEEICRGCKKNIVKFTQGLSGVVLRSEVPDFLWFEKPEEEEPEEAHAEEDTDNVGFDLSTDQSETTTDTDNAVEFAAEEESGVELAVSSENETQEIEFDLADDTGQVEDEVKEEIEFDLPGMEEKAPESPPPAPAKKEPKKPDLSLESSDDSELNLGLEGLDFDLDDSTSKAEQPANPAAKKEKAPTAKPAKEPSLDLGGLDLSGLMPSAAEEEKADFSFSGIGELSLESEGGKATSKTASKKEKAKSPDALPDLSMDGLDLSSPILPPAASAAGKKMRPAAKTGTALDDFNIDLGDLLGGGGKNKK